MSVPSRHIAVWSMLGALVLGIATAPAFAQGRGRVSGTAVDEEGNPLAGVLIVAENPNTNPPQFEATTGSNGRFAMLGFRSGQWTFTATLEGYRRTETTGRVSQGQNPPLSFTLARELHLLEVALGVEALEGLDPAAVTVALSAADALYKAEDWEGAIAGYEALLEKLPMLTNLHLQIGNALRSMGNYDEAIAAYERLKAADPSNTEANTEIARTKMAMGDFEAASEELAAVASRLDASREDLYNLGELEFAKGAVDEAAAWYEKAAMVDPNWGKPLFKLALVALNKGDTATAKELLQKVIDVDPDSEESAQAAATIAALP